MCDRVALPGGGYAIVCGGHERRKCTHRCGRTATKLCDGPGKTPGTTCDRPLCARCATHAPPDRDYCREHAGGRGQASMF